jgi:hypothetical protein
MQYTFPKSTLSRLGFFHAKGRSQTEDVSASFYIQYTVSYFIKKYSNILVTSEKYLPILSYFLFKVKTRLRD